MKIIKYIMVLWYPEYSFTFKGKFYRAFISNNAHEQTKTIRLIVIDEG